jgi:magnesium chelatase family protein
VLELSVRKYGLSARAHDRILKMARSRADLEGHPVIKDEDMHFAVGCRVIDRQGWLDGNRVSIDGRRVAE